MEIKARRRIAARYQCPECGAETFQNCLTPTKRNLELRPQCYSSRCGLKYGIGEEPAMQVVERRWYTLFTEETDLNGTMRAGTLKEIGRFTVCQIVHPNIRAFRAWVEQRRTELAEQNRQYQEEWAKRQAEGEARRKKEEAEQALLKEAQEIAYNRGHAIELQAEKVARAVWPEEPKREPDLIDQDALDELNDHPF